MVTVDGGPVVAHAQAFADEINRRWGITHIMTYAGHEPDQQHALDSFSSRAVMLQLADWCTHDDVIDRYGIDYVIFNVDESTIGGEIYNREISQSWRHMPDRGNPTQNHHDHVHVSFNPTAAGPFGPTPTPEEDDLPLPTVEGIPGDQAFIQMFNRIKNLENAIIGQGPAGVDDRLTRIEQAVDAIKSHVGA